MAEEINREQRSWQEQPYSSAEENESQQIRRRERVAGTGFCARCGSPTCGGTPGPPCPRGHLDLVVLAH
ncbi:hypothetical protein ACLB2K_062592 [Fragaria x ananassa]